MSLFFFLEPGALLVVVVIVGVLTSLLGLDEVLLVLVVGDVRVAAAVGGETHDVLDGVAGHGVPGDLGVGFALLGEGNRAREEVTGEFDLGFGGCGVLNFHTIIIRPLWGKHNTKGRRPTTSLLPPHLYENCVSSYPSWTEDIHLILVSVPDVQALLP